MSSRMPRCSPGVAGLLVGLIAACSPQAPEQAVEPATHVLQLGECAGSLQMAARPVKLAATRVTLQLDAACPPAEAWIVEMDMPEMPMNVAPVALSPAGPRTYAGVVMFTMAGRWRVTVRARDGKPERKDSFDVDAG